MSAPKWTQSEALALCVLVEQVAPDCGCHVALTGGLLYKDGPRKDCDLLFYRIRQEPTINMDALWLALEAIGIELQSGFGWVYKAAYQGKNIDCFFPESPGGEYTDAEREEAAKARHEAKLWKDMDFRDPIHKVEF